MTNTQRKLRIMRGMIVFSGDGKQLTTQSTSILDYYNYLKITKGRKKLFPIKKDKTD